MGVIEQARGNLSAARHEFEMALRRDPNYAPARQALEKLREQPTSPQAPDAAPGRALLGRQG